MTAVILTYFKEILCAMTENMHADLALSRQAVFVRCCLSFALLSFIITAIYYTVNILAVFFNKKL